MNRNCYVDILRIVLICWIVLYHYTYKVFQFFPDLCPYEFRFSNGGRVGVMMFFIISGFFISHYIENKGKVTVRESLIFLLNKYWRLWPAYFFSIIIIYFILYIYQLPSRTVSFEEFLINLFFIYHPRIKYVDQAHWFITSLLFVYFIVSLSLLLGLKARKRVFSIIQIMLVVLLLLDPLFAVCSSISNCFTPFIKVQYLLTVFMGWNIYNVLKGFEIKSFLLLLFSTIVFINYYQLIVLMFLFFLALKYPPQSFTLLQKAQLGSLSFNWYLIHQNIGYCIIIYLQNKGMMSEYYLVIPILTTAFLAYVIGLITNKIPQKLIK